MVGKGSWREAREDRRGLAALRETTNERAAWWLGGQSNGRRAGWAGSFLHLVSLMCGDSPCVTSRPRGRGLWGLPHPRSGGYHVRGGGRLLASCVAWRSNVYCCVVLPGCERWRVAFFPPTHPSIQAAKTTAAKPFYL